MAVVTKINSNKALVKLSREELIDHDVAKWVKGDSYGINHRFFLDVTPIERVAAKYYNEKYPSETVKIGEKFFYNQDDGSVDVVLRIANATAEGYYNSHPTKVTYQGFEPKTKKANEEPTIGKNAFYNDEINFLIEHIAELNDDELFELEILLEREKSAVEILFDEEIEKHG